MLIYDRELLAGFFVFGLSFIYMLWLILVIWRRRRMNEFWTRVLNCEHKHISPNYLELIACGTPYCSGTEYHCLDCGAYVTECGCHFLNGVSGWPRKRYLAEERKRRK